MMKEITLREIASACNGDFLGDSKYLNNTIENVTIDSRQAAKGTLFVAIKGERTDGHKYIEKAFEQGAVCALSEQVISADKPVILVRSTAQAIKDVAEYYRSLFENIEVVGITGSVGKTSTKEVIASVLEQNFVVHKTKGNFNNELGVPLTLLAMPEDTEIAVVEMGINHFGEMTRLSKMVRPTVCVFTNIGNCHLENLIDRDGVFRAKTEMLEYKEDDSFIIVNGDDDKLSALSEADFRFGLNTDNDFYAENITANGENGVSFTMCFEGKKINAFINAIGSYMVTNALAAAAVGRAMNMKDEDIVKGIASYKTVGSRASVITTQSFKIIDDCYNANPASVKAAIDSLVSMNGERKVAILGDMKELGNKEVMLHGEVGFYINDRPVDVLITVGQLAKTIGECASSVEVHHIGVADPAIWDAESGISFAETAGKHGIFFQPADNARIPGWMQCQYRLMFDSEGYPMFYVFNTCREFIRTIPTLQYD
ncbi:MAG: UDP-N-acetylmuramoyl-tripeptide--D-alanyl-D-alanine ligase, partial [Clostridia bacterium]|nr:UDP-N-acetylmuramoyl-tripeptide--D-alanyl-D-alanine ligase [Clostridia bacterium]